MPKWNLSVSKRLVSKLGWVDAYIVRTGGKKAYRVMFEDTELVYVTHIEEAERIAALLNGAYNLGRSSAYMEFALVRGEPKK
jgi:hypothetical protein